MPRKHKADQAANRLTFTDEADRPKYKLKTGEVVPMSDKRIAAMKKSAWDKGESGNPDGRPPLPEVTKMKMYEFTEEAIEILKDIARNSPNEAAKLKAALSFVTPFVASAAPVQEVNHTVSGNISVGKFLMSLTEDFERDPSLLIDATPDKTENPPKS